MFWWQCVGDHRAGGWGSFSAEDISSPACTQTGALPPCTAQTAGGADEDHGQCGNLLHAAHAFHLHIQVQTTPTPSFNQLEPSLLHSATNTIANLDSLIMNYMN